MGASYTQSLIHPTLDIKVVVLQWGGGQGNHREFCEPWQRCHLCPCKLPEQCKCLGNTHKGAQSLHSLNTCHHCQDITIINSPRSNINTKAIPKLASPKEQTLSPKQAEMFWGGEGNEYTITFPLYYYEYIIIYYTFSYIIIYEQFFFHLAFTRIFVI